MISPLQPNTRARAGYFTDDNVDWESDIPITQNAHVQAWRRWREESGWNSLFIRLRNRLCDLCTGDDINGGFY